MTDLFIQVNLHEVVLRECKRCGSTRAPIDPHHVTYKPSKRVSLCRPCHIGITVINGTQAQYQWGPLDNTTRRQLFKKFMKCEWRMDQEEKPITKLVRRRIMSYKRRLPVLQAMFFGGDK